MSSEISEHACLTYLAITKEILTALAKEESHAKATHERFNVFSILLNESDEVRLHTRFLHCLLDPRGAHDCDSLFLKLFLQTLLELQLVTHNDKRVESPISINERKWTVSKEASLPGHGQIDLLLESPGFGIAIENKIHAGEQPKQLECYKDYLQKRHGSSFALIYLTLDGKIAYTAGQHDYYRISYKEHILAWLDSCLRETYHIIPVNQALIQYRAVVRRLTKQNLESEFMKPVLEMIRQNPDIVRFREIFFNSINEVRNDVLDDFAGRLIARAKSSGCDAGLNHPSLKGGRFGMYNEASIWITPHVPSAIGSIPYKIWLEFKDERILLGMKVPEGVDTLDARDRRLFDEMNQLMNQDSERSDTRVPWTGANGAWLTGWDIPVDPLNDDVIANWMKPGHLKAEVDRVWEAIENHIRVLERAYLAVIKKDS